MKLRSLAVFLAMVLFTACLKDPLLYPDGWTPPGSGDSGSYQPLQKGASWTYVSVQDGIESTATTTLNGDTRTFGSKLYHEGETSSTWSAEKQYGYYHADDHIYIIKSTTLYENADVEMEYLNDTASVGYTWTRNINNNGSVNGVPGRIIGTITEKNITKTVYGQAYPNVIHTTLQLQYNLLGEFETYSTYEFYIARNVGIIAVETTIDMFGIKIKASSLLKDYSL